MTLDHRLRTALKCKAEQQAAAAGCGLGSGVQLQRGESMTQDHGPRTALECMAGVAGSSSPGEVQGQGRNYKGERA